MRPARPMARLALLVATFAFVACSSGDPPAQPAQAANATPAAVTQLTAEDMQAAIAAALAEAQRNQPAGADKATVDSLVLQLSAANEHAAQMESRIAALEAAAAMAAAAKPVAAALAATPLPVVVAAPQPVRQPRARTPAADPARRATAPVSRVPALPRVIGIDSWDGQLHAQVAQDGGGLAAIPLHETIEGWELVAINPSARTVQVRHGTALRTLEVIE